MMTPPHPCYGMDVGASTGNLIILPGHQTNQMKPISIDQVKNNAGGYVYDIGDMSQFKRFLILGSASGSYYASARDMTHENAHVIDKLLRDGRGEEILTELVRVSISGRAPKQSPGLFVLAICCRDEKTRGAALKKVREVCRTASTLMEWLEYMKMLGGISWGRAMRKTVLEWYVGWQPVLLAYQVTKYQNRNGWCHRDVMRLVHPAPKKHPDHAKVFGKIVDGAWEREDEVVNNVDDELTEYMRSISILKRTRSVEDAVSTIAKFPGKLSWEHIGQTELLKSPSLWKSLLIGGLPMTAMIRNLNRFADIGLFEDPSLANIVFERLTDPESLARSRIHPINLLQAHKICSQKHRRQLNLLRTLDSAFYLAFGNVRPTGKRILIGLDVSTSMNAEICSGMSCLTAMEAAAAMTLMLVKTSAACKTMAFAHGLQELSITSMDTLKTVEEAVSRCRFGATDASLPMTYALKKDLEVDCFVVLTDSETYMGGIHPSEALKQYRQKVNKDAKLAVLAFSATKFSIADPQDAGMLDIAGMDLSVPDLLRTFMFDYEEGA